MEIDTEYLPATIIIYILVVGAFWVLPGMAGVTPWDLSTKLIVTFAMIPLSYFIVPYMANK